VVSDLTVKWANDARRDQVGTAIADELHRQAWKIRQREESFCARHPGTKWDEDEERFYRALTSTANFLDLLVTGTRGVAMTVAAANKKDGKLDYHKMPLWVTNMFDQLRASFIAPIHKSKGTVHEAGMEDLP
jgi:hypothetical protein